MVKTHSILLFLGAIIVFVFGRLVNTFFQQDEWSALGLIFAEGLGYIFPESFRPIDFILAKGRMLSSLVFYLFAVNFPFQNFPFAVLAMFLHLVNTFLVFLFSKKIVRNTFIALLGAVFFAANSVSQGAVTWSVIAISTIGSSIPAMLAILCFFKFTESSKKVFLLFAGLLLYLSLWFKETGLYFFLFAPLAALLFKRYNLKSYPLQFWWFLAAFILLVGYRIVELRFGAPDPNLYLSSTSENFFLTIFIRLILYPLTSFSLMFVPGSHFLEFAREVLRDNYAFFANSPDNILIAQSVILDLLAVVLTGFLLVLIFLLARRGKLEDIRLVVFWLVFVFLSFTPYVVLAKDFAYLESRYYYLPVAGGAVLVSWLLKRLWEIFDKRIFFLVILPLYIAFVSWHVVSVKQAIDDLVVRSGWRKQFIADIKTLVPTLHCNKNIVFISGEQNYWVDGNRIPFQQGSGATIMVLYYDSGKIPAEFLKEEFLFEIGSQGYKEIGEHGFGFFVDEEELTKAVEFYNLPSRCIINLHYSRAKKLGRQAE